MRRFLLIDMDFILYESYSLKDKRRIKNILIDKLNNEYNISIIESDNQDIWNIISVSIAYVGINEKSTRKIESSIKNYTESIMEPYGILNQYNFDII